MSCCGKSTGAVTAAVASPRMHASQSGALDSGVAFEYVGATGLTAIGRITKRTYVFSEPGAKVTADRRDAPSLRAVPFLRQVSGGS